ncbi:MAG: glutamine--scyllo-inositol aminotransferase, partial [Ferrovum sp.]|nr:glutamine--scyllo-inositol aminotransferase [Ferrovum sp.]
YYRAALSDLPIRMNPESPGTTNGFWMPTLVVEQGVAFDREALLTKFKAENIDGRVFFWPLSMLPMFQQRPQNQVSYSIYGRAINLPSYHDITDADLDRVITCVTQFVCAKR